MTEKDDERCSERFLLAARLEVEALRRREYVTKELAPLGARYALEATRITAERDLEKLPPEPERERREFKAAVVPGVKAVRTMADPIGADEDRAKAALRDVERENTRDRTTAYTRERACVQMAYGRIARWEAEKPRLAAMLADEAAARCCTARRIWP